MGAVTTVTAATRTPPERRFAQLRSLCAVTFGDWSGLTESIPAGLVSIVVRTVTVAVRAGPGLELVPAAAFQPGRDSLISLVTCRGPKRRDQRSSCPQQAALPALLVADGTAVPVRRPAAGS